MKSARWTEKENTFISDNYIRLGDKVMATVLDRTTDSVRVHRRRELHLSTTVRAVGMDRLHIRAQPPATPADIERRMDFMRMMLKGSRMIRELDGNRRIKHDIVLAKLIPAFAAHEAMKVEGLT